EAGGITVQDGITLSSGNLTLPASSSLSWGSATLGLTNQTLILGSDNVHFGSGNAKLLQIDANPDNKVVDFTTNQTSGFRFNQSITIAATRLIMQPNSRLGIGIDNPGAILDVRGAVNRAAQPNQIIARFAKDDTSPQLLIAVGEDGDKKLITILGTTGGKLQLGGKDATTPAEDNAIEVKGVLRVERLTTNSSRQLKENISEISSQESSEILKRLSPVKFNYKDDAVPHLGFIAEDVPEILASPDRQSINPVDIVAALAKVVQDHQHTISVLGQVIRRQQESIVTLQERLSQMEQK
ncbi:MAG TPA: tail fiber domain-containing protein, partial [Allocoleopsis sp.]